MKTKKMKTKKMLKKVLISVIGISIATSTLLFGNVNAAVEKKTVKTVLASDDFSSALDNNWKLSDCWGVNNPWDVKDGCLHVQQNYQGYWGNASRSFNNMTNLSDSYDLNINFKIKGNYVDSGRNGVKIILGTNPALREGTTADDTAATLLTLNGTNWSENVKGFYYTNSGAGVPLYNGDAGFDDTKFYCIKAVAHINKGNYATFDIAVYDETGTNKLAEQKNISTSSEAGSVEEPTCITFFKYSNTTTNSEYFIDDLDVFVSKDVYVSDKNIFEDNFDRTDGSLGSNWIHSEMWGNPYQTWNIKDNSLAFINDLTLSQGGYNGKFGSTTFSTATPIDVSNLPDKYDLNINYKVKSAYLNTDGQTFKMFLSTNEKAQNAQENTAATVLTLNGTNWTENVKGFYYTNTGAGLPLYNGDAGYNDSLWYTVRTVAHIERGTNATFNIAIYDSTGNTKLAEQRNISTNSQAGSVQEPTYLVFNRQMTTDMSAADYVDDLKISAEWETDINSVTSVKTINLDNSETPLTSSVSNAFGKIKVGFKNDVTTDTPNITLYCGDDVVTTTKTVLGSDVIVELSEFLKNNEYTLSIDLGLENPITYKFTPAISNNVVVGDFGWYKNDEKITNLSQLSDGENDLTLKVRIFNPSGDNKKSVSIGYGAYNEKYLKAVFFKDGEPILTDIGGTVAELSVKITKGMFDRVSGFALDGFETLKPYTAQSELK